VSGFNDDHNEFITVSVTFSHRDPESLRLLHYHGKIYIAIPWSVFRDCTLQRRIFLYIIYIIINIIIIIINIHI